MSDGPPQVAAPPLVDRWEALLLGPADVRPQLDPATGCGAACLEMALRLELGSGQPAPRQQQISSAAGRQEAVHPEEWPHPFRWATSPSTLQHYLNSQLPSDRTNSSGLQHYHIAHAAAASGPLEEILFWLRGHQTVACKLCLPSFLLTRHGTHWMLAVGACVEAEGLAWLAVADPGTGRLLGLTAAGVNHTFTPNTIGKHPDWTNRHVAVIPSVLPRRPPAGRLETAPPPEPLHDLPTHSTPPSLRRPEPIIGPSQPITPFLPADEEIHLEQMLARFARQAVHPLARQWLAPLHRARHIVGDQSDGTTTASVSVPAGSTRRAWVLDAARAPIAELLLRGTPAILLNFAMVTPSSIETTPAHTP